VTRAGVAPPVAGGFVSAPDVAPPEPVREVFVADGARASNRFVRLRRRISWPLGIYTTPVLILVLWEALSETGILGAAYAPAPTVIVRSAVDLWQQGVLGPDLAISLRRASSTTPRTR
jgi:sulfonate transport system permease protein